MGARAVSDSTAFRAFHAQNASPSCSQGKYETVGARAGFASTASSAVYGQHEDFIYCPFIPNIQRLLSVYTKHSNVFTKNADYFFFTVSRQ